MERKAVHWIFWMWGRRGEWGEGGYLCLFACLCVREKETFYQPFSLVPFDNTPYLTIFLFLLQIKIQVEE